MLPQNDHQNRQQQQPAMSASFMSPSTPHSAGFDGSPPFNLDSSIAKQMAALNAANLSRIANNRPAPSSGGGTSSGPFLGGISSINQSNPLSGGNDMFNSNSLGSLHGQQNFQAHLPQHQPNANQASNPSFVDPSMSQAARQPAMQSAKQRQRNFLVGLANLMASRNTPLPPALTGLPSPRDYDPTNSPWKGMEISSELGSFRLAGKDVDLFKLWGTVFQYGGGNKLTHQNSWSTLLKTFDLPEHLPTPVNGTTSTSDIMRQYYTAILHPFEEAYKRNIIDQQRKAAIQGGQRPPGAQGPQVAPPGSSAPLRSPQTGIPTGGTQGTGFPGQMQGGNGAANMMAAMTAHPISASHNAPSSSNGPSHFPITPTSATLPNTPQIRPSSSMNTHPSLQGTPPTLGRASSESVLTNGGPPSDTNVLDQDGQGIKRKNESEEPDLKRVRQKTESEPPDSAPSGSGVDRSSVPPTGANVASAAQATPARPRTQPSRRKIEYIPLAREVDTHGGRDLNGLDEMVRAAQRRPVRDINDWGNVDIEALTMSIRSRLSTELSYALTTFTLLSTMRGQTAGSGFPIFQCSDLLDELLDLLEDEAFGTEDLNQPRCSDRIVTHREMVNAIYEEESLPFAGLDFRQGSKDPGLGPKQRPGNTVVAVMNILRNLSMISDNLTYLSQHERLVDLILRICGTTCFDEGRTPHAAARSLSLGDLITVRKDTLYILINTGPLIHFPSSSSPSNTVLRMASRMFDLIASYLIDPAEAVSPVAFIKQAGMPPSGHLKPPSLPDMALEAFTRLGQPDSNRQVFSKAVSQPRIWCLFEALVHRLPVADGDYQLLTREHWLSYLEKTVMAIYSLAFLSPPELKDRVKKDRALAFSKVMIRMVQKCVLNVGADGRNWFLVTARRAIEAMKVIDDGEDSFDTSQSTAPTMTFGVGYGEVGETGAERGTGLLGGYRDVTWDIMLQRELDEVMFSELESLVRVE